MRQAASTATETLCQKDASAFGEDAEKPHLTPASMAFQTISIANNRDLKAVMLQKVPHGGDRTGLRGRIGHLVELVGIEPTTSSLRTMRSPSRSPFSLNHLPH